LVLVVVVIPAPRVYTKAVAVKALVVEFPHPVQSARETGGWGLLPLIGTSFGGCPWGERSPAFLPGTPEKELTP